MHCIDFHLANPKQHREVGCTEGNFGSYIEDLKKRKGPVPFHWTSRSSFREMGPWDGPELPAFRESHLS